MPKHLYTPKQFGSMIGRSVRTLQKWDVAGTLKAHRNPKNRRYYTHDQYLSYLGIKADSEKKISVYCRVSSNGQKDDLSSQREALEHYCCAKGYSVDDWLIETGSGLNYNRKKFNQLMEEVELGKVSKIIIAHKDRLMRFGYEWFESFAHRHGTRIEVMNQESLSPEAEMTKDLLSIIHCFSSRLYGLRKYKKDIKHIVSEKE
jgi:predicted site-specific integrase-resolvase